jgi:hypothetical protein
MGAAVGGAIFMVLVGVVSVAGGRRTTPCMAGKVRVLVSTGLVLSGAGVVAAWGAWGLSAMGTGLIEGGRSPARAGFGLSGAGWKGGGSSGFGRDFLALKKMSGQGMDVGSCAQFQGRGMMMTPDPNAEALRKQDRLFCSKRRCCVRLVLPWHITCFSVLATIFCPLFTCHLIVIMPLLSGTFATSNLTEILRVIVNARQTGYLKIKEGEQEGCLAVEDGIILHARAGSDTGLPALFQFVGWRQGRFDFHERPLPEDLSRDLAAYDPQVLITGVAFKVDEQTLLHEAIPSLDSVLCYMGGEGLASVEVTSADLGLLALADGRRTVREIGQRVNMSPMEVARTLARFRLAGVLELAAAPASPANSAMAATG